MASMVGDDETLAHQVLPIDNMLAQEEAQSGQYKFPVEDEEFAGGDTGTFALSRDDTHQLIGLLNSSEIDAAKHQLGSMLHRLDRPAVEGLTRRLFATLRHWSSEHRILLEAREQRAAQPSHGGVPRGQGTRSYGALPRSPRDEVPAAAATASRANQRKSDRQGRIEHVIGVSEAPARTPRGTTDGSDMPHVFRRLSAPPGGAVIDDYSRARMALASSSQPGLPTSAGPPITIAGMSASDGSGPPASQYLGSLLEAHEMEVGHPATSSRRMPSQDSLEPRSARGAVPEEQAKQIFDRLYKAGKEYRVRRRVYQELGLLVEQAKEAQICTFEPNAAPGTYRDGYQAGSASHRLYNDGKERQRRREDQIRNAPVPSFQPQTVGAMRREREQLARLQMREGVPPIEGSSSPRDTLDADGNMITDGDAVYVDDATPSYTGSTADLASDSYASEPTHLRLHREHADRLARKARREETDAEWRKHSYRPDISTSQASGQKVIRESSLAGYLGTDMSSVGSGADEADFVGVSAGDEAGGLVPSSIREEDLEQRRVQHIDHAPDQDASDEDRDEFQEEFQKELDHQEHQEATASTMAKAFAAYHCRDAKANEDMHHDYREQDDRRWPQVGNEDELQRYRDRPQAYSPPQHIKAGGSLAAQAAAALPHQAPPAGEADDQAIEEVVVDELSQTQSEREIDGTSQQLPMESPGSMSGVVEASHGGVAHGEGAHGHSHGHSHGQAAPLSPVRQDNSWINQARRTAGNQIDTHHDCGADHSESSSPAHAAQLLQQAAINGHVTEARPLEYYAAGGHITGATQLTPTSTTGGYNTGVSVTAGGGVLSQATSYQPSHQPSQQSPISPLLTHRPTNSYGGNATISVATLASANSASNVARQSSGRLPDLRRIEVMRQSSGVVRQSSLGSPVQIQVQRQSSAASVVRQTSAGTAVVRQTSAGTAVFRSVSGGPSLQMSPTIHPWPSEMASTAVSPFAAPSPASPRMPQRCFSGPNLHGSQPAQIMTTGSQSPHVAPGRPLFSPRGMSAPIQTQPAFGGYYGNGNQPAFGGHYGQQPSYVGAQFPMPVQGVHPGLAPGISVAAAARFAHRQQF